MKKHLLAYCLLVFSTSISTISLAQDGVDVSTKKSYLFIGNSFTYMNDMPDMFDEMANNAGKNVFVKSSTKGGANFEEHAQRTNMFQAISSHKWDNVIIQGHSREFIHSAAYVDSASIPHLNKILDSIYVNNPCTNVYFYMTWGYEDGYGGYEYTNEFENMADTIHGGYQRVGQKYLIPVVPIGAVWKNVKLDSRAHLYSPDKFHPNHTGSYLVASTFFSAFFDEKNTYYRPIAVSKKWGKYIANEAYEYVHNNREVYALNTYHSIANWDLDKDKLEVSFSADYPNASEFIWTIDGEDTVSSKTGWFQFDDSKEHTVKLDVSSECGNRTYFFQSPNMNSKEGRLNRRKKRLFGNKK